MHVTPGLGSRYLSGLEVASEPNISLHRGWNGAHMPSNLQALPHLSKECRGPSRCPSSR